MPIKIVVPTLLHMGCIESPTYFFTVLEKGQDVTDQYIETSVEALAPHKFVNLKEVN